MTIWTQLLTAIPDSAPEQRRKQLLRQRKAEEHFLGWLENNYPEIYEGARQLELGEDVHRQVLKGIFESSQGKSEVKYKEGIYRKILISGRERLQWTVDKVVLTVSLPRVIPLLTEKEFRDIPKLRRLTESVHARLHAFEALSREAKAGLILFSAIVHGGLFKAWKQEAMLVAPPESWVVERWGSWVELFRHHRTTHQTSLVRWFPDPLTELLILNFWKKHGYCRLLDPDVIPSALRKTFAEMEIPKSIRPVSAAALAKWASNMAALSLPPFLREAANDRPFITSLPAETWARLYSGMKVFRREYQIPMETPIQSKRHSDSNARTSTPTNQVKFLRQIRRALNIKGRKKQLAAVQQALHEAADDPPGQMPLLIASFILDLMRHGSILKDRLEASSIKRYLGAIQNPLIKASMHDPNVMEYSAEDWEECLQKAIDLSNDQQTSNRIAAFGAYISSLPDMPDLDLTILEGARAGSAVHANLISPAEFDEAVQLLSSSGRIRRIQRLVAALGFYCGLRRNEILTLLVCDVAGRSDPELLVRPNKHASTKNKGSRRVPVGKLLPEAWRREFIDWFALRLSEQNGRADRSLLFCMPSSTEEPLPPKVAIDPVVHALHDTTGDQSLVFHSLRHSCANWLLMRMLIPELPEMADSRIALFNHPLFSRRTCMSLRDSFHHSLVTPSPAPIRDILAQVSEILGHRTPEITLKNYVHLIDWLLRVCFTRMDSHISEAALRALTGLTSQYWFEFKRKKLKGRDESQWISVLLDRERKSHQRNLANPILKTARKRRQASPSHALLDPIAPHDIPSVLKMLFYYGMDIETVSRVHAIDPGDIARIRDNAERIREVKTRYGNPRLPYVPSKPRARMDIRDFQMILENFELVQKDSPLLCFGLTSFLHGDPSHSQAAIFGTDEEVKRCQKFLQMLGVPKTRMMAKFFPDCRLGQAESRRALKYWSSSLDIPLERIQIIQGRRKARSLPESTLGHISVTMASNGVKVLQQSVGLKSALHVLLVFMFDRYQ